MLRSRFALEQDGFQPGVISSCSAACGVQPDAAWRAGAIKSPRAGVDWIELNLPCVLARSGTGLSMALRFIRPRQSGRINAAPYGTISLLA